MNIRAHAVQLTLGLLLAPIFLLKAQSSYYVSINGNDVLNSGTSPSAPFRTIQQAANVAPGNSIIYIGSGTYYETVTPNHNTNITFAPNPTNTSPVTISGAIPVSPTAWSAYGNSSTIYQAKVSCAVSDVTKNAPSFPRTISELTEPQPAL